MPCDESWIYCYDPETKRQSSQWNHAGSPRPKKARQSESTHKLLMILFLTALAWSICTGFPLGRVNKKYNVEVLREFRKRFRRKRPALFKSGQWHFHQDNAPVHNSILVTDNLSKMGINTISHQVSRTPLRVSLWDNWADERGCGLFAFIYFHPIVHNNFTTWEFFIQPCVSQFLKQSSGFTDLLCWLYLLSLFTLLQKKIWFI